MGKLRGLFVLDHNAYQLIYGPQERSEIAALAEVDGRHLTSSSVLEHKHLLRETDVLFYGWGAPLMDERFRDIAPNLRAVFYGAGAVGYCVTESVWERGIVLTSAYAANARPVAEYALSMILFSLKHGWRLARETRQTRSFPGRDAAPGC